MCGISSSSASGTDVTILHAQYPTWSQANEYPVTPKDTVAKDNEFSWFHKTSCKINSGDVKNQTNNHNS